MQVCQRNADREVHLYTPLQKNLVLGRKVKGLVQRHKKICIICSSTNTQQTGWHLRESNNGRGAGKKPPSKGRKLTVDLRFLGIFSCMFQNTTPVSFNIVKQHWLPKKSPSVLGVLLLMAKKRVKAPEISEEMK